METSHLCYYNLVCSIPHDNLAWAIELFEFCLFLDIELNVVCIFFFLYLFKKGDGKNKKQFGI